ncbi:sodium:solute symporter [Fodinibius halophilus]|uniref:Sodium/solute symporter n=1 Tax=Fodinibius halophilus TaxID=1736908 RepID=A0A6M1T8F6_9BACT|nr:sodium:solute symporter [Fodinibius halophilus]NGP88873.1 sodium/solute symporter [Fodinibius halophilus]
MSGSEIIAVDLSLLDIVTIGVYFLIVFAIAWWASHRERSQNESTDYFLAGRDVGWFVVGASLFASNIGSEHLIGLAGSGFAEGVPVAQYEILAGIALLMLGWIFVPFYLKSNVSTMPEFLERRYDTKSRMYLSVVSIIGYVLTKISVTIYAGGIVFEAIGVDFWVGAFILVVVTGIYTIFGGLKAVVYTDLVQMFVLLGGALAVTFFGLQELGGWGEMTKVVDPEFFSLWRSAEHTNYPWTGILFGAPILGIWYWCTDQFIVQRVLSARDEENARKGTIFAGYLKMLPLFIFVLPGIVAYALVQQGALNITEPNDTLPVLAQAVLPVGLRGLVIAGLFAALMSSLSSVFNSCSTLITLDFYKKFKEDTTEHELVIVGQVSTVILVILGLLWIPFMEYFSNQLFLYLQSVQAYIAPPITAVFLVGLFYKRLNSTGAFASLISGFVLGFARFFLELYKSSLSGFWHDIATINFLHFALLMFVICTVILITVSLFTEKPDEEQIKDVIYHKTIEDTEVTRRSIWLTIGLLGIIAFLWIYFS